MNNRLSSFLCNYLFVEFNTCDRALFVRSTPLRMLDIDDFDLIEMVMYIEDDFKVDIPDVTVHQWTTLGDIDDFIELIQT